MRSSCAIYVDAGYLLASAATRVTGTSLRSGVRVDNQALIEGLIAQAEAHSSLPLLRVNWYDSGARPGGQPDIHQDEIGLMARVKLRLGRLSRAGEQKGVDLRIGLDLATHARNRIVDVMYLVSGDDDLTEAVEEAQGHGIQVILLVVPDPAGRPHAVARHLQREADGLVLIDPLTIDLNVRRAGIPDALVPDAEGEGGADSVEGTPDGAAAKPDAGAAPAADPVGQPAADAGEVLEPVPSGHSGKVEQPAAGGPTPGPAAPITPSVLAGRKPTTLVAPSVAPPWHTDIDPQIAGVVDEVVSRVVTAWCGTATPESLVALRDSRPFIPGDLDRTLLVDLSSHLTTYEIEDSTRYALRDRFWEFVDRIRLV